VRDINEVMPRVPNMRWGALTNVKPTRGRLEEMRRIFPDNGRWHTVLEGPESVTIDGRRVERRGAEALT